MKIKKLYPYGPTNDVIFKAMFGHDSDPELMMLKDFVYALTNHRPDEIIYEDREIDPAVVGEKEIRLDLRVLVDGKVFSNIEMQMFRCKDEADRAFVYMCMSVASKTEKGKNYSDIIPVKQIFILDYIYLREKPWGVHSYFMKNDEDHSILTTKGSIVMIEIPKILDQIQDYDHMSSLEKWVYFLRYGNKVDDSVIQKLSEEPVFMKALEVVKMVNNDQRIKDAAFARMRHELDLNQSHYEGKREGLKEGREEGRQEGLVKGEQNVMAVMQMLKRGFILDVIQKETEMELEKILEIQALME